MQPDHGPQPDHEFTERLAGWFVNELTGEDRAGSSTKTVRTAKPSWIDIESDEPATPRHFRRPLAAAAALLVAGGLGTVWALVQRNDQPPAATPVIAVADLDALCVQFGDGYAELPLTPSVGETYDVGVDVEQRLSSSIDRFDELSGGPEVVDGEARRLMSLALDTARALQTAAASDEQSRIDRLVANLDGLVAGWASELTRMGATACEPAPMLRDRP